MKRVSVIEEKNPRNMVANAAASLAGVVIQQSISVQCQLSVSQPTDSDLEASSAIISESLTSFDDSDSVIPVDYSRSESGLTCSISSKVNSLPCIRSGSHTDIGPRRCNEDEHILIDDISLHLGSLYRWPERSSFYAIFDGHGGSDAAVYVKNNVFKFFLKNAVPPLNSNVDEEYLEQLVYSQREAFLLADKALADECIVDITCGTTALTAIVIGRHVLVSNAGDSRAVLSRKGTAVQMSQDHRPSCALEQKRVEELGGFIEYGYLNGELSVTRALGDWYLKQPIGSECGLTAEPEIGQFLLTDDDEFLIIGCDGIWDVMSNQEAVSLVRRELRKHDDPQLCAKELVSHALLHDTCDNLTAIVVCFTKPVVPDPVSSQRPRLGRCSLSEEAQKKLRMLLEWN